MGVVRVEVPAGASTAGLTIEGGTVPVAVAGTGTFDVMVPLVGTDEKTIRMVQGGNTQGQTFVVKPVCDAGSRGDTSGVFTCREVLAHSNVVVGVWDRNNRFYFVGQTGFTPIVNKTPWNNIDANLFYYFGGIRKTVTDEFCRIRVVAVDSVSRQWRQMYIDAKRGELHVLPGTEAVQAFDPIEAYDFVHRGAPAMPTATAYALVSGGEFFTPGENEFNLFFRPTGQPANLIFSWVAFVDGNLKVMRSSTCVASAG